MDVEYPQVNIISHKSKMKITVGKDAYNKLGGPPKELRQDDGYIQDKLLMPVINQDMLYNIMLNNDIKNINHIGQVNKIANNIYNSKIFWKEKFMIDYPLVKPNSTNWKQEYIKLHNAVNTAINMTKVIQLKLSDEKKYSSKAFINIYLGESGPKDIDITKITWLPDNII